MAELTTDVVVACADLVGRAGAAGFELGWDCPHTPGEPDGHSCPDVTWYAHATYQGARIIIADRHTPTEAAMALTVRLLDGATCRCGEPVTLADGRPGCRWRLVGQRWEPGCDAPPVRVNGPRGDHAAMVRAMALVRGEAPPVNRAERRALRKARREGR